MAGNFGIVEWRQTMARLHDCAGDHDVRLYVVDLDMTEAAVVDLVAATMGVTARELLETRLRSRLDEFAGLLRPGSAMLRCTRSGCEASTPHAGSSG